MGLTDGSTMLGSPPFASCDRCYVYGCPPYHNLSIRVCWFTDVLHMYTVSSLQTSYGMLPPSTPIEPCNQQARGCTAVAPRLYGTWYTSSASTKKSYWWASCRRRRRRAGGSVVPRGLLWMGMTYTNRGLRVRSAQG